MHPIPSESANLTFTPLDVSCVHLLSRAPAPFGITWPGSLKGRASTPGTQASEHSIGMILTANKRVERRGARGWEQIVFIVCLAMSAWAFSAGWTHSILDLHGFRQAQTAISVRHLLEGSSWLAYEVPVLGAPWAVPFEFPLYQWLTAGSTWALGIPVDQSGRLVSVLFFYLSLVPLAYLLAQLGVKRRDRLLLLSLVLTSPLYLFWSRDRDDRVAGPVPGACLPGHLPRLAAWAGLAMGDSGQRGGYRRSLGEGHHVRRFPHRRRGASSWFKSGGSAGSGDPRRFAGF